MQDIITFLSANPLLSYALFTVLVLLMIIELWRLKSSSRQINTTEAVQLMNREHAHVIDLRHIDSFKKGHIIDATSISAQELSADNKKLEKLKAKPLILVCSNGHESQKIAAHLQKQGYNIYSLTGGMRAWLEAQMPIVKE